jgi:hypothetical protein
MTKVSNRFLLVRLASRATRALHKPNSRIQETMNGVFVRFGHANPTARVLDTDTVQLFDRAALAEPHSHCTALMHWCLSSWVGLIPPLLQNISLPTNAPMSHRTDGRGESC